ncbi:helix-turn-helix domain-containing protein [Leptobacterium flavescens]|uniref:Helix-turn-helix domain-containing protein n=1 Tax=Leptobacterium flavescens TaxID=472055 RepID=A0A6P0UFR2_9FLAO|nr:helix-turn-helix domain-containing protein [Leptobacterium flavescens]
MIDIYEYFKKHPRFNKLVGSDYLFVEYKCPLNVEEFRLWTESHMIIYVINGRKDWVTPSKTYSLAAGDALLVKKGVYVTKQYMEDEYCVMMFFINDQFIQDFMIENRRFLKDLAGPDKDISVFDIDTDDFFLSLVHSIFHYLKDGENIPESLVNIKFRELLFNIVLNPRNRELLHFFNEIYTGTKANIESIMLKNFQYDLKIEDFAKLCGRSLSAFKRDFKNCFNNTPSRWLNDKRLEYAKTLLIGSDLSISEVCYESGFKNTSHFTRAFKQKYQSTPRQFKNTHINA